MILIYINNKIIKLVYYIQQITFIDTQYQHKKMIQIKYLVITIGFILITSIKMQE
jgi:hypothetical protein